MPGNQGFTLLETIVSITIFCFVFSAILFLQSSGFTFYVKVSNKVEVEENLRIALARMSRNIRDASSVSSVADNPPKIEIIPAAGNDVFGYRYDTSGKEIEESIAGTYLPIASHITFLQIKYAQNDRTVSITARGEKGNSGVVEMSTKVLLRAIS
ncbi:prepilin-type N-terminal cleavage/methylation domain-containing protein [Pelotomaculum propionicicum]|uniref:Prepilin-type N-terminal cleavage/methylation domain-containing protein n=1 Tax=Pelotomaculum propionicicum TaxID=258475 RepID=A0A4Y7RLF8_9FIRM|nr:prepilin-type N-terminal cleavage/methylation domain-containing protein [Pelotomaculum propionicicum]NLI11360.1 prepilin-type N-terminal cleavage/methylation domain-containing protein [Peptococcaceae bacterium]TEB09579.1 hypothetical protein Pmgp_03010 [Pelotomaculum propionicicum]